MSFTPKKKSVLIVDDSAVFRTQIELALSKLPNIEVVGKVPNGKRALDFLEKNDAPDLVTLDLEMPELDGLGTLKALKSMSYQGYVIVLSAFSKRGAEITLKALNSGATDFITKPQGMPGSDPADLIADELNPIVSSLFEMPRESRVQSPVDGRVSLSDFRPDIVLIGSSTGGPTALEGVFCNLKGPLSVPIVIVQHMPPLFTASLANRLTRLGGLNAKEAEHGERIQANTIYIAPGGKHLTLVEDALGWKAVLDENAQVNSVRPAVDKLFESVAMGTKRVLAIVLTGMGSDGRDGCLALKKRGKTAIIIQDEASSVVYGMPGAVREAGLQDSVRTLGAIGMYLSRLNFDSKSKVA